MLHEMGIETGIDLAGADRGLAGRPGRCSDARSGSHVLSAGSGRLALTARFASHARTELAPYSALRA